MYADVHLHLYEAENPASLVEKSRERGVDLFVTAGEDVPTSGRCVDLTELPGVYAAVGVHPSKAREPYDVKELERLLEQSKVVAVGEVGLDAKYERFGISLERQRRVFLDMVRLAREYDLPLVVHSGRSFREVLNILFSSDVRADLHWYSGSVSLAVEAAESGFMFSLGPAILHYKNYNGLVEALPLSSLMTETDYPVRIGGVENGPWRVTEVVKRVAEVKGENEEKVGKVLYNNTLNFFKVKP